MVVSDDDLIESGFEMARAMLRAPPMGRRMTKKTPNLSIDASGPEAALMLEDRQQVILIATDDYPEAPGLPSKR